MIGFWSLFHILNLMDIWVWWWWWWQQQQHDDNNHFLMNRCILPRCLWGFGKLLWAFSCSGVPNELGWPEAELALQPDLSEEVFHNSLLVGYIKSMPGPQQSLCFRLSPSLVSVGVVGNVEHWFYFLFLTAWEHEDRSKRKEDRIQKVLDLSQWLPFMGWGGGPSSGLCNGGCSHKHGRHSLG